MKTDKIQHSIINALQPRLSWFAYAKKWIRVPEDLWGTLCLIAEAAAKAAESEWLLAQAGSPHRSTLSCMELEEKTPQHAGFHLSILTYHDGIDETLSFIKYVGHEFELEKESLGKALQLAEEATREPQNLEVQLEVSWAEYLPSRIINPLYKWRRDEQ
ncbi:MAG: hypothetical protein GF349_04745 [Candidatus Magasanikbacteria bacterium]|nr:hypothetical protein [Candidatus Magasanikbacteria bacterium]